MLIDGLLVCQGALAWVEPILNGPTPAARKGVSAACTQNRFVVIFGGKGVDADAKEVLKEDLLLLEMDGGPYTFSSLDVKGSKPAPRINAMFQECGPGKLMLYGGIGADGKPLNDAWVLDLEKPAWSLIYMGHSDLCPPQVTHADNADNPNYAGFI